MDSSIKLMVKEELVEKDMSEEKVLTIDLEKGEIQLEISDKVLAEGGRKLGEILRTIKNLTGEAQSWTII